jgi:glycosyltransferase involved in cell wall biosynthesis
MSQKPKISVIIPVYNVEKYLKRCLESVSNQTFEDFEIIAVNDGTKDNSLSILEEYAKKEKRLQIISQENQGLSAARNTGIKACKGEYIYFLDSDDAIHPQCLEIAYHFITKQKAELVCFDYEHSDGNEYNQTPYDINQIDYNISSNPLQKGMKYAKFNVMMKFFHRDLIGDLRFIPGISFEDYPFTLAIFAKKPVTVFIDTKLYFYTRNMASITKQSGKPKLIEDYIKGVTFVCNAFADDSLKTERETLKQDFIPLILKHQIGRCRRADKENKKAMLALFRDELLELKKRGWLSFKGHKLRNWLTYQWMMIKGK